MIQYPAPETVFTPRSPQLNPGMYIERPELEKQLMNALRGQKHVVLFGESGNGKTWLYNRVFDQEGVFYTVLNLASANMHDDLFPVIEEKAGELGLEVATEVNTEAKAGAMPQGIGGQITNITKIAIAAKSQLSNLLAKVRGKAGGRVAVLVLDNFEQVQNSDRIIKQIASMIVLLDDPSLATWNVKLLIVGVPGDIRSLLSKAGNAATLSNRTTEIAEVARLSMPQAKELFRRGLEAKLGFLVQTAKSPDAFYARAAWISDRIAQHIHELGLAIARRANETSNRIITDDVLLAAEKDWLQESLASDCAVVELAMNSRDTKAGRKNQTLYALGLCETPDFKNRDIEAIVRKEFPKSTADTLLDIPGMMSKFGATENPLIRRSKKEEAYRFVSPKYRMAIRAMLARTDGEKVQKVISF